MIKKIGVILKKIQNKSALILTIKYFKVKKYNKTSQYYKLYFLHDEQNLCRRYNLIKFKHYRPFSTKKFYITKIIL